MIPSITAEGIGTANTRNSRGKSAALYDLIPNVIIKAPFKKTTAENTVIEAKSLLFKEVIFRPARNNRAAMIITRIPDEKEY
jgi:hypothetical protein